MSTDEKKNTPEAPTPPKPALLILDGDGLVCDPETGVCEIPQPKPVKKG